MLKYQVFNSTPFESHSLVMAKIHNNSKVLDLGCATGYFAKNLLEKKCEVTGIDIDPIAINKASKFCNDTYICDLEDIKRFPPSVKKYDYILMLDLIEHLKNPINLLKVSSQHLKQNGKILISTPNIAFISLRLALLRGKFEYTKTGLMDETHLKFFTRSTLIRLIQESGLKVDSLDYSSGFSQITLIGKYLNYLPKYWQYKITKLFPTLLGYQLIATCTLNNL